MATFRDTLIPRSELYEHGEQVRDSVRELTKEISKISHALSGFPSLADATGLSLSVPTLRNLKRVLEKSDQLERLDPSYCSHKVFREVLGVENDMAFRLRNFFGGPGQGKRLRDLEGMTDELYQKINTNFLVLDDGGVSAP